MVQMSDEDLREQLMNLGEDVGPLNSSTRQYWEKLLAKHKDNGKKKTSQARNTKSSVASRNKKNQKTKKPVQIQQRDKILIDNLKEFGVTVPKGPLNDAIRIQFQKKLDDLLSDSEFKDHELECELEQSDSDHYSKEFGVKLPRGPLNDTIRKQYESLIAKVSSEDYDVEGELKPRQSESSHYIRDLELINNLNAFGIRVSIETLNDVTRPAWQKALDRMMADTSRIERNSDVGPTPPPLLKRSESLLRSVPVEDREPINNLNAFGMRASLETMNIVTRQKLETLMADTSYTGRNSNNVTTAPFFPGRNQALSQTVVVEHLNDPELANNLNAFGMRLPIESPNDVTGQLLQNKSETLKADTVCSGLNSDSRPTPPTFPGSIQALSRTVPVEHLNDKELRDNLMAYGVCVSNGPLNHASRSQLQNILHNLTNGISPANDLELIKNLNTFGILVPLESLNDITRLSWQKKLETLMADTSRIERISDSGPTPPSLPRRSQVLSRTMTVGRFNDKELKDKLMTYGVSVPRGPLNDATRNQLQSILHNLLTGVSTANDYRGLEREYNDLNCVQHENGSRIQNVPEARRSVGKFLKSTIRFLMKGTVGIAAIVALMILGLTLLDNLGVLDT